MTILKNRCGREIAVAMPRLANKAIRLSEIIPDLNSRKGGLMKVHQPPAGDVLRTDAGGDRQQEDPGLQRQPFLLRFIAGREYFPNADSFRTYPYFEGFLNKIVMYPIMSPGEIKIRIRIDGAGQSFVSEEFMFTSPSHDPLAININDMVKQQGLKGVTAFSVLASAVSGKIPTRVNHQLIYGEPNGISELNGSINVSLMNTSVFVPVYKKGYTWASSSWAAIMRDA